MTNVPVKDYNQTVSKVTSTKSPRNSNQLFNHSFAKVMNKTDNSSFNLEKTKKMTEKTTESLKSRVYKKREDVVKKSLDTEKENKNYSPVIQKEIEDEIKEKAVKIVSDISKQLGVSEEEVMDAVKKLGLQMTDLLNTNQLAGVVVEISGETDILSLATNEGLYQSLQNLSDTVEKLMEELQQKFSLTNGQMEDSLNNIKEQIDVSTNDSNVIIEKMDYVIEQNVKDMDGSEITTKENIVLGETIDQPEVILEDSFKNNDLKPKQFFNELEKELSTDEADHGTILKTTDEESKSKGFDAKENESSGNGSSLFQGFTNQTTTLIGNQENVQTSLAEADVENIMKQITDYMKIQVKGDLSEIELQLHPASLGTINLQIASKAGVITAQFTAQNEAVKQALETQIVQLRENLEQQGIKIEAVEVTIASHEFERNLDKGNHSNTQSQQGKKQSVRRINMNDLSMDEEQELDPGELLTRDIMVKDGNTVDYTA